MTHVILPFHYVHEGMSAGTPLKVIPIWIDRNFGEADKVAIDDAIMQWNFALNGFIKLEVRSESFDMDSTTVQQVMDGRGWMILKIDSYSSFVHDDPLNRVFVLAFANRVGGNRIFVVRDRIENNWMTGVALHEIGHLLGAVHTQEDLMQPHFNWESYRCIDKTTIQKVAEAQHLPARDLNYCVYGDAGY